MTEAMRDGFTVYELDEDGVNRWSFHVQPGTGLDGKRQPDSVIERVAEKAHLAYNNYDRLREALEELAGWAHPDVTHNARALLAELDKMENES